MLFATGRTGAIADTYAQSAETFKFYGQMGPTSRFRCGGQGLRHVSAVGYRIHTTNSASGVSVFFQRETSPGVYVTVQTLAVIDTTGCPPLFPADLWITVETTSKLTLSGNVAEWCDASYPNSGSWQYPPLASRANFSLRADTLTDTVEITWNITINHCGTLTSGSLSGSATYTYTHSSVTNVLDYLPSCTVLESWVPAFDGVSMFLEAKAFGAPFIPGPLGTFDIDAGAGATVRVVSSATTYRWTVTMTCISGCPDAAASTRMLATSVFQSIPRTSLRFKVEWRNIDSSQIADIPIGLFGVGTGRNLQDVAGSNLVTPVDTVVVFNKPVGSANTEGRISSSSSGNYVETFAVFEQDYYLPHGSPPSSLPCPTVGDAWASANGWPSFDKRLLMRTPDADGRMFSTITLTLPTPVAIGLPAAGSWSATNGSVAGSPVRFTSSGGLSSFESTIGTPKASRSYRTLRISARANASKNVTIGIRSSETGATMKKWTINVGTAWADVDIDLCSQPENSPWSSKVYDDINSSLDVCDDPNIGGAFSGFSDIEDLYVEFSDGWVEIATADLIVQDAKIRVLSQRVDQNVGGHADPTVAALYGHVDGRDAFRFEDHGWRLMNSAEFATLVTDQGLTIANASGAHPFYTWQFPWWFLDTFGATNRVAEQDADAGATLKASHYLGTISLWPGQGGTTLFSGDIVLESWLVAGQVGTALLPGGGSGLEVRWVSPGNPDEVFTTAANDRGELTTPEDDVVAYGEKRMRYIPQAASEWIEAPADPRYVGWAGWLPNEILAVQGVDLAWDPAGNFLFLAYAQGGQVYVNRRVYGIGHESTVEVSWASGENPAIVWRDQDLVVVWENLTGGIDLSASNARAAASLWMAPVTIVATGTNPRIAYLGSLRGLLLTYWVGGNLKCLRQIDPEDLSNWDGPYTIAAVAETPGAVVQIRNVDKTIVVAYENGSGGIDLKASHDWGKTWNG